MYFRVSPERGMFIACRVDRIDIRGEHQVSSIGRGGLITRHDSITAAEVTVGEYWVRVAARE